MDEMEGEKMEKNLLQKVTMATSLLSEKMTKKKRGGKEILVELGLALVMVSLLVIFRDQVGPVITSITTFVSGKIQALFTA